MQEVSGRALEVAQALLGIFDLAFVAKGHIGRSQRIEAAFL
ncbi:MAG: hypothetical protein R3C68_02035 [Myxococcota bacterium]